jgi:hypothetical protein
MYYKTEYVDHIYCWYCVHGLQNYASNYFGFVKDQLRGQRYETTEAMQKAVRNCLRMAGMQFYRSGIFKLPERWEKCVQRSGDFVEK